MDKEIKVLYIHGRNSSIKTEKAVHLAQYFNLYGEDMDTNDNEKCVQQQALIISKFKPHIVIGSSFGGYIAVELMKRKLWQGPTILLAQAWMGYTKEKWLPEKTPILIVHGTDDDIIPIELSKKLATAGTPGYVEFIEVKDSHRLHSLMENEQLVNMVRKMYNFEKPKGDP